MDRPDRPSWRLMTLDRAGSQRWLETRTAMQHVQPGLTSVLYSMMNQDRGESVFWFTEDIPTMAVDGRRIWANPTYLFGLPIKQRIAGGFHEVLHGMFRHPEQLHWHRKGNHPVVWKGHVMPFDARRCVKAMDYPVNAILAEGGVGELASDWLYDPAIATSRTAWQEAYYKLWQAEGCPQPQDQQPQPPGQGPPQPGGQQASPGQKPDPAAPDDPSGGGYDPALQSPQDYHAEPGTSQGKAADDPGVAASETEWKIAIKAGIAAAEKAGKLPGVLQHAFEEMLETKVTWTDYLQGLLARGLGGGGYNWRKADRRFLMRRIYIPARSGKGCGTIVVVGDSSGSIYRVKGLVDRIFAETKGVLEQVKPRAIVLIWCDAEIKRIDELTDPFDLEVTWRKGAEGGGGTKFKPAFDWVRDNLDDVDAMVYFTDGENYDGDPGQPEYPVIWGHIGKPEHQYPWGERVDIPTDGTA